MQDLLLFAKALLEVGPPTPHINRGDGERHNSTE